MIGNINYLIWFKVARPIKHKYKLSTNCTLILNACYIHSITLNKPFTRSQMRRFANYFNPKQIDSYIKVLIDSNYISLVNSSKMKKVMYYSITLAGLQVIQELNNSYEIELRKFIDQYNIIL
jgi:hypothetical protein